MLRHRLAQAALLLLAAITAPGLSPAHEFWIEPGEADLEPGDRVEARLMVGRMLEGVEHPYLAERIVRFTLTRRGRTIPVRAADGDLPALSVPLLEPGLHVFAHQTTGFLARYDDRALFGQFLAEEGFDAIAVRDRARAVPGSFVERYSRYAKALVSVGELAGADRDRPLGLPVELIAETLPFRPDAREVSLRLLEAGAPVAGRQVAIFHRARTGVTRRLATTDAEGRASLPLSGPGFYLVSAVLLKPVDQDPVFWESRWASLSFRL